MTQPLTRSTNGKTKKYKQLGRPRVYPFRDVHRRPHDAYRAIVLAHFNNECQYCGSKINLGIHHIDGNPHNDNPENLTLLCLKCNRKAEKDLNIKIGLILHQLSVGQTRREIAQYLRFTKQALHYYFKRMEKESFIERVGKKESRSGYVLKPKGQVVLDKLQSRRQHQI